MTKPITETSIQQRIALHPEVGGLPPDASEGDILMYLSGEVSWGGAEDLDLQAQKITDGETLPTELEVSSVAPELLARFQDVTTFKAYRTPSSTPPATVLEAFAGDALVLKSLQGIWINGSNLSDSLSKLSTVEQGAQKNWTDVNVNSEAVPTNTNGDNVLTLPGQNSLSEALTNLANFPFLANYNRSYTPRQIAQIVSNFSPPKFNFARDTTTTPDAIRSFSTNDILGAVQYLPIVNVPAATSYTLGRNDTGKLLSISTTAATYNFNLNVFSPDLQAGFYVIVEQANTGKITFVAGAGVSVVNVYGAYKTFGKGALVLLVYKGAGVWNLSGAVGL